MVRLLLAALAIAVALAAQDYVCPMDSDVRSDKPGVCPRCGMTLVLGIPEPLEYPLHLSVSPRLIRPGLPVELVFTISDPGSGAPVTRFQMVHEKLFHMFLLSEDLRFFVHDHPVLKPDGTFHFETSFPRPGLYRVLGDFYPEGGTPQLAPATIFVPGGPSEPATLKSDLASKTTANMDVELVTEPAQPVAGLKTLLFFRLKPTDGLQKYLGAWGHLLAASDDLVDMIHTHPFIATGGPQMQFNIIFPRARTYRVWVQFQRNGVVNTAAFNVPVSALQ